VFLLKSKNVRRVAVKESLLELMLTDGIVRESCVGCWCSLNV
jgi:hypothetical protein